VRSGPGVAAGSVLIAVRLAVVSVALVDGVDGLLAVVAGKAVGALALVAAGLVVAGGAVEAGAGGTVIGRIACN
jgi:hypothetical protein